MNLGRPNKVEQYEEVFAEYRRLRDPHGEERLLVTMRLNAPGDKSRVYHLDMDALERFATLEVPPGCYAKPHDHGRHPDVVHRFKGHTAFFHATTKPEDGSKIAEVHFRFAKETHRGPPRTQNDIWIRHEAIKEFSAHGVAYEQELGYTKRWYPVVRVIGIGEPNGIGVVRTVASIEDKGGARERARVQADQSREDVLWPHPFRRRFEVGDEFTVNGRTEGHIGNDKITRAIIRLNLEADLRRMQDLSQHELPREFRHGR